MLGSASHQQAGSTRSGIRMWASELAQAASNRTLGMTSAISLAPPKPADLERARDLETFLRGQGLFEADAELHQRSAAVSDKGRGAELQWWKFVVLSAEAWLISPHLSSFQCRPLELRCPSVVTPKQKRL